jgi:hypothetical protein
VIIYKNLFHTSEEKHSISTVYTNRLKRFREIITVYCENRMKHINTLCEDNAEFFGIKAGGKGKGKIVPMLN